LTFKVNVVSIQAMRKAPYRGESHLGIDESLSARELGSAIERALLAAIVDSSDDAIVSKTLDGRIRSWNRGAARLFGYQPEEIVGQPITTIIPPELHDEERQILERLKRGERIDHFETIRVRKDGRRIPISLTVSPIRDSTGVIIGASKVARDISERKRAEYLQEESERLLTVEADALAKLNECSSRLWRSRSLGDGLDEMLAAVIELLGADKGAVQLYNQQQAVLEIAAQRGFEQGFLEFFGRISEDQDSASARALRSRERVVIGDIEADALYAPFRDAARAVGYRAIISSPLIGKEGAVLGIISMHFREVYQPTAQGLRRLDLYMRQASDFIERYRLEEELRRSEEGLRDADRRKNEFLALLAHELRNPLAPIRYALATRKKAGRTLEQQQRADEVIERQVAQMSHLLDDLLDVSRITRGILALRKCYTELTLVLGAAIEAARPILDAKHHTLTLDLPKHAVRLEADPVRLGQVFSNLLINAGKYTDPGGHIELRAAQDGGEIVVSVSDNGIGMSAELIPRLFTPFTQARTAIDRSEGGLGLGLALVRGLITLHGGSVEARSAGPECGTEMIVRLPASEPPVEVGNLVPEPPASSDTKLRIMIVDDNKDAADTCEMLLKLLGHEVQTAHTGLSVPALAESFRPHVLLLDIGLPDISGYELAKQIRCTAWGQSAVLIAVTGWGQEEDKRMAFAAGFDHHLAKPVDPGALEALLQTIEIEQSEL
jgi:PAS domain S-box-containing protein